MTRINVVPVETLSDKHLMDEFLEITRPFGKVRKRLESGIGLPTIPDKYVLGTGHESFFFNKLDWLFTRYLSLVEECLGRGFKLNLDNISGICVDMTNLIYSPKYHGLDDVCWKPTPEDMYLNMARLCKRSNLDNVKQEMFADN